MTPAPTQSELSLKEAVTSASSCSALGSGSAGGSPADTEERQLKAVMDLRCAAGTVLRLEGAPGHLAQFL